MSQEDLNMRRMKPNSWSLEWHTTNNKHQTGLAAEFSFEGLMLKLTLQYFGHLIGGTDSLEKTLKLGKIEGIFSVLLSHFSRVWLFSTPWTAAHQAPPSMGFSRQEYWSGCHWCYPFKIPYAKKPAIPVKLTPVQVRMTSPCLNTWKFILPPHWPYKNTTVPSH